MSERKAFQAHKKNSVCNKVAKQVTCHCLSKDDYRVPSFFELNSDHRLLLMYERILVWDYIACKNNCEIVCVVALTVTPEYSDWWIVLRTVLLSLLPLVLFASVVILIFWLWRRRSLNSMHQQASHERPSPAVLAAPYRALGLIQLLEVKASGRFGCVWKAQTCDGSFVAVKIFPPSDRQSWMAERGFYSLPLIASNCSILRFIGAEMNGSDYWLVTDYHDHGSLYDYLKRDVVTVSELLKIALSMCHGLAFLHTPMSTKPQVAHRDFKSRNVLIRQDLTACIADFGLALILDQYPGDVHSQVMQGNSCILFLSLLHHCVKVFVIL